nr:MAG TPA: protein of unknown function (DUF4170) [Caudoviricetes sp.]
MDIVSNYNVNEYFNGELVKTYSFDSYLKAFNFWHEMHRKTKNTYFIRYMLVAGSSF